MIFLLLLTPNVVILCDVCLEADYAEPSPKRKLNPSQRSLESYTGFESKNNKSPIVKSVANNTIESLSMEIKKQTATIAALQMSVEEMHGTIKHQTVNDLKLVEMNNGQMSSINKSLNETKNLIESINKPSYANVVKRNSRQSQSDTPKSTKSLRKRVPITRSIGNVYKSYCKAAITDSTTSATKT